jgi:membrane-bound serine protease (ClpP class)
MEIRNSLLALVATPDRAVLTLMLGMLLVYRELARPGRVLPGVAGAVAVITAIWGILNFRILPFGLMLAVIGCVLILVQGFRGWYGIPGSVGAGLLTAGTHLAIVAPWRVSLPVALCMLPFSGITIFLLRTAVRARRNKVSGMQTR